MVTEDSDPPNPNFDVNPTTDPPKNPDPADPATPVSEHSQQSPIVATGKPRLNWALYSDFGLTPQNTDGNGDNDGNGDAEGNGDEGHGKLQIPVVGYGIDEKGF